jgi:DNA (cytosine-5)-methyltransferase 1
MIDRRASDHREVWSLFSGAMGLDLGLASAQLRPQVAVELDPACAQTVRANPAHPVHWIEDSVSNVTAERLRRESGFDGDVWLIAGGPPCQAFSPGGNREGLSDPRGNLIFEYFRIVKDVRPAHFLFENVANLTTAALKHRPIDQRPGKNWNLSAYASDRDHGTDDAPPMTDDELAGSALRFLLAEISTLKDYQITFGVVDAASYGAAQHRLRFVMLGSRDGEPPPLNVATHNADGTAGCSRWRTLRDVIWDLRDDPGHHYVYTEGFKRLFELVPPGGYWKDLPPDLQRVALGNAFESGGGKTGFFRRLSWDTPAPTITGKPNRKGAALCHPEAIRPLSVRECARIQGFPDDWVIAGTNEAKYRQIGNAVPVALGAALGKALVTGKRPGTPPADHSEMLSTAIARLRSAGRNKKSRKSPQLSLLPGALHAS